MARQSVRGECRCWRAGCAERRPSGSERGSWKRDG